MYIDEMMTEIATSGISWQDLYLSTGDYPRVRNPKGLMKFGEKTTSTQDINDFLLQPGMLPPQWLEKFNAEGGKNKDTIMVKMVAGNLTYTVRITLAKTRILDQKANKITNCRSVIIRHLAALPGSLSGIGLPENIFNAISGRGLNLVAGAIGNGKTTTFSTIIDRYNRTAEGHIITIEKPVEYFHPSLKSKVTQRQVPNDVESFTLGAQDALQQRADLLGIGEMIESDTIEASLNGAEAGLIVVGTIHAASAVKTIDRLVGLLGHGSEQDRRNRVASALNSIIFQRLLPAADEKTYVTAFEVLTKTPMIEKAIREGNNAAIEREMEKEGAENKVMVTFDQTLAKLVREKKINQLVANQNAFSRDKLAQFIKEKSSGLIAA